MKHKKHLWLFLIFAVAAIVGWMMSRPCKEGFMSDDEYLTEMNHRIKSIQTIKTAMNATFTSFNKSITDTCDITKKYRDEYLSGRSRIEKYNSLSTSERNTNATDDYTDERNKFMVQNRQPLLECFANPGDIRDAQATLRAEMKDLRTMLQDRKLRTFNDKGALAGGLYEFNASFFGQSNSGLLYEKFADAVAGEVREELLNGADELIKEARVVQDTARTTSENVDKLNNKIGKVAEYIEKRGKVSSQGGVQRVNDISSYFYGAFKVAINYGSTAKDNLTISMKDTTNITVTEATFPAVTFPEYRVFVYVSNQPFNKDIMKYINQGGNIVFTPFAWHSGGHISSSGFDYDKYTGLKHSTSFTDTDRLTIRVKQSHPIVSGLDEKILEARPDTVYYNTTTSYNNNDVLATINDYHPLVVVKTIGTQRFVSLNIWLDRTYNDVGRQLLRNCILWAAGRI